MQQGYLSRLTKHADYSGGKSKLDMLDNWPEERLMGESAGNEA
jgi:hypothetical protein